ncbi:hypothetical protein [Synechococcus sp. A15-60]|uniref:hypothetical protein n=1 Tax=Synechococcus sp. A15-60 TaxID=1050655 RepID=UPI001644C8A5|nr:hypothetical protein [Synechococcus sp. A15-60]QNI49077.1 hypothetical protein SynA1560_02434 [Synechococcus sp. A15-60]
MHTFHPESDTPLTGHEQYFADVAMDALDAAMGTLGISYAAADWDSQHFHIGAQLEEAIVNKLRD